MLHFTLRAKWVNSFSEGIPFYTQSLCHEAWYLTEKKATIDTFKEALDKKIIATLSAGFIMVWDEKIRSQIIGTC